MNLSSTNQVGPTVEEKYFRQSMSDFEGERVKNQKIVKKCVNVGPSRKGYPLPRRPAPGQGLRGGE